MQWCPRNKKKMFLVGWGHIYLVPVLKENFVFVYMYIYMIV